MSPQRRRGLAVLSDGARISWTASGDPDGGPPVVLLHGGPGLPDYLGTVAAMIDDLVLVYRYDQRGTGNSPWEGTHSLARHLADLDELLDVWGARAAVVAGHSYGAGLACRFCLARPERVSGLLMLCGPFVGDWRQADEAERDRRMTPAQRERLRELDALGSWSEEQERELLTLSWFTDHADPVRGLAWAARAAGMRRPVNWSMNRELGSEAKAGPLGDHLDALRAALPGHAEILGGARDPRPVASLAWLARRLGVPLRVIDEAGHEPWLEQPDRVRAALRDFLRRRVPA